MNKLVMFLVALVLAGCASTSDLSSQKSTDDVTEIKDTLAIEELIYDGQDVVEGKEPRKKVVYAKTQLNEKIFTSAALKKKTTIVKQASLTSPADFKKGMNRLLRDCNMRLKPTRQAAIAGVLRKGKKVWTESQNKNWAKVYRKYGRVAYVYKGCF